MTDVSIEASAAVLTIKLNPASVARPAQTVATSVAHVVVASLNLFSQGELGEPALQGPGSGYRFRGPEQSSDQRRIAYQNWLLSKGFQDLARGIRESLEEAVLYLAFIQRPAGPTNILELQEEASIVRRRAAAMNFPNLMAAVNAGLTQPLAFESEFLSLQKMRNCLEHRGGIVGEKDVENGELILSFPRLAMFYERDGYEFELPVGEVLDTHAHADARSISVWRIAGERRYKLVERLVFSATEFNEVALACHIFAGDLASKLPQVGTAPRTA